jgi:hypothetical protein
MEVEIVKPQTPRYRNDGGTIMVSNENARVINVTKEGHSFEILVALTYRNCYEGISSRSICGGSRPLHSATMAVGVNHRGDMSLIKNRYGRDGVGVDVRESIMRGLDMGGFCHYEAMSVMATFNTAVSGILGEPVFCDEEFPLGINYRDYWIHTQKKSMVKKYRIKRHSLV